jgi:Domain of unknown function (DUF4062)/Tetratricopeptide repeat
MGKVYVSSTIADLKRERRTVIDWLVAAQHQVVHSYRPSSDTVRDGCLDDVDTCDLYVLILGHRYGFQPSEDNPESLSITHLEFRRAGQKGKPRVALLRTSIPDVSRSDMADPPSLARVMAFREEVAGAVRPGEFGDLRGLVTELSTGVQAELDKLSPASVTPARVLVLAPRPPFLAGREDLLAELEARLSADDDRGPRIVALHGLAGIGKSSVALVYAHNHLADAGVAWQFTAEDPAVLVAAFGELAAALGAREGAGDPVDLVHAALAAYPAGWLLIFDNAPDRASVEPFLPRAGDGRVLITSRNAFWPPGQALEVPVLDLDAAAIFLATRTGDADHQAALGLAEAVGGLPLALEQAAAYIQATGGTLAAYQPGFYRRRAPLLVRGEMAGYPSTVEAAWALAYTQVEESAPEAAGLLRLLAFCAPDAVPLSLLLQPRHGLASQLPAEVTPVLVPLMDDGLAVKDAVAALRQYSLVRPAGDEAVSVHRLVQAVTADQMPADLASAWRQAAAMLVEAALRDGDPRQPADWPAFAALLPHARAVLDLTSGGMWGLAQYLGCSGSYPAARDMFQLITDALNQDDACGPEHPDTLSARANLASWTGEAGDAAGARDQYAALLPTVERVLGPEYQGTLSDRSNLAYWTGLAGDAAGARDQYAALLPIRERVLGPEHPDTLTTRNNLASWTGRTSDAAGARDQLTALLPTFERVLGPEHPGTLANRGNLAYWTGEAGDAAGARDQLTALLPTVERVLGSEHPETLIARAQLASRTGGGGDAATAREQLTALLPILERVLGPEHPDTFTARANLARWTGEAGNPAGARDQYAALLPICERVLGAEHPDTLNARHELAYWTERADGKGGAR